MPNNTCCPICERDDAERTHPPNSTNLHMCCRRCGSYVLTDRAEEILLPELAQEPDVQLARARASHAIRSRALDKPVEIDGDNCHEFVSPPLPDPPTQRKNLIAYLKKHAGDAPFASIDIADRNALLGVVGAANEEALETIVKSASEDNYLSQDGSSVKLKPKSWE